MAAVLACGLRVVLSHESAAALWRIRADRAYTVHVSAARAEDRRPAGIVVHRSLTLCDRDLTRRESIPVTTPIRTLIDLGTRLPSYELEAAMNEADKLELVTPAALRAAVAGRKGQRGVRPLREILDRGEFVMTDSELERRFLAIARRAGLGTPLTQHRVNGFRVDFYWPELGLVVETDGLRYHRTASEQTRDRVRDQAHIAAGLTALRFTHWQVRYDSGHVERILQTAAHARRWGD
jgi:very-short-patch-repair endonuclease